MKQLLSWFKKDEESPETTESMAQTEPDNQEEASESPEEEEEISLGTKVKVVAALAVVGFATYVAYWVQEPTDFKAQVIDPNMPAAEEMMEPEAAMEPEETMVAATDADIEGPVQEVAIIDFTFTPANITVEEGTTVVWTNIDAVEHTITSDFFTSEVLNPGDSFVFTFDQEGTYDYFCSIHPQMKGKINVTAAATAPVETLPDNNVVTAVDEEQPTEVLSPEMIGVETTPDTPADIVTLDAEEFLQEPPATEDDTLVLSLPEEVDSHTAANETPGTLAKSGPEDVLYVGLFGAILFMTRRKLALQNR